jgi:hypothetical protein
MAGNAPDHGCTGGRVILFSDKQFAEGSMATNAMDKAAAAFKKQQQAREGKEAMTEYRAAQIAEEKKTERLRALRLAQEAAAAVQDSGAPETSKRRKSAARKPG